MRTARQKPLIARVGEHLNKVAGSENGGGPGVVNFGPDKKRPLVDIDRDSFKSSEKRFKAEVSHSNRGKVSKSTKSYDHPGYLPEKPVKGTSLYGPGGADDFDFGLGK